ncbi:MAG: bifunctional folylpolyglutamate synthase/dihydrofolate synthase [Desulfuromonas sp.]|nr:MAG: bifunctional folylpolyglutamate synthase/dihydrofolate synthase [Desulfuromonas sp.]
METDYRESLDYLYGLQFFGIKLGLDNIRSLLAAVGNPQDSLRSIHIAGTNGKGSTAAALASIFHAAGIPAGLYTSPHLHDFSERIRIDTRQIDQNEVVALIRELRPHADSLRATFFEFTTAMALLSFQRHGVEWAILETGMGGRLDATNAVTPELCLLTSISLDHTAYLGDSLAAVAAEKAGIFKPGTPVLSVAQPPEVMAVLQDRATELSVPLAFEGEAYLWESQGETFSCFGPGFSLERVMPTLPGTTLQQNLALATAAIDTLRGKGLTIGPDSIRRGLESVCWPGRLEWLPGRVLLDGAHNPAGAASLASYLRREKLTAVHLVVGCKGDKDAAELLSALLPFTARVYATCPPVDKAIDPELLAQQAQAVGVPAVACADPAVAIQTALKQRHEDEVVVVAGSLFLVAAARELLLADTSVLPIVSRPPSR